MPKLVTLNACSWCGAFRATIEREWTARVSGTMKMGQVCEHCWRAFLSPPKRSTCGCRTHRTLKLARA